MPAPVPRPLPRGTVVTLAVAVALLLLPAVVREPVAVLLAAVGAMALLSVAVLRPLPVALGTVRLHGTLVTVDTVRDVRTVDLDRLRSVGGHRLREGKGGTHFLSLTDDDGTWLVVFGQPGFPAIGDDEDRRHEVLPAVREAVVRGGVPAVSEAGKAVLGLPARRDPAGGATAVAWVLAGSAAFAAAAAVPVLLWSQVVPV